MEILFALTFLALLFVLRGFVRFLAILAGISGILFVTTGPSLYFFIFAVSFTVFLGAYIAYIVGNM